MPDSITMLGTLPPIKGVSDYCIEQTRELAKKTKIRFFNFSAIYPESLYPGGGTKEHDNVFSAAQSRNIEVINSLSWYNPFGWVIAGMRTEGKILHFHWWTSWLFPVFFTIASVAKMRGKKLVCTIHNVVGHDSGPLARPLSSLMFLLPDIFIVHTRSNKAQLETFFNVPSAKIRVVPHGIYNFYRDREVPQFAARKKLGIPPKAKVLLFFGNIRPYKGIDELLPAFISAREKIRGLFLIVAGKPWNSGLGNQISEGLARVKEKKLALGYIASSEIKYYFSAADAIVLPYKDFAAQSGPGNIALAFEKPLVVSDCGGLPELVKDKGVIFEAGNSRDLAKRIITVFSTKGMLERLSEDSAELREKYSWKSICQRTMEIYSELSK